MSEELHLATDGLFLALETSSARGSIALARGRTLLGTRVLAADRRHTAELLPAVRDLLAGAGQTPGDVNVLCFSQGPGSFTGLRVAATIARMWQSAVGCRVVAVPSLEVIARNALAHPERPARLAVVVDARGGRVFGAVFERAAAGADAVGHGPHAGGEVSSAGMPPGDEGRKSAPPDDELRVVIPAGTYPADTWLAGLPRPCWVLGEGAAKHAGPLAEAGLTVLAEAYWWPDAVQVLAIGQRLAGAGRFCEPGEIVPAYLRPPECEEVYEQRRAAARARRSSSSE